MHSKIFFLGNKHLKVIVCCRYLHKSIQKLKSFQYKILLWWPTKLQQKIPVFWLTAACTGCVCKTSKYVCTLKLIYWKLCFQSIYGPSGPTFICLMNYASDWIADFKSNKQKLIIFQIADQFLDICWRWVVKGWNLKNHREKVGNFLATSTACNWTIFMEIVVNESYKSLVFVLWSWIFFNFSVSHFLKKGFYEINDTSKNFFGRF